MKRNAWMTKSLEVQMMLKLFPKKSHGHGILADTMYLIEANPKGKHRTKVGLQLLA